MIKYYHLGLKELGKIYAGLFVRIAAIAFYLFLVSNLSSFMEQFNNPDWAFVLKAFLMVGMLIFAKQVPDMIGKIFGVEMKSQGGIAGRLGSMAGVGNVAKKAWEAVRNPIAAAAGVGSMALGTGAHIASAARTSFNNGKKAVQRIRADGKKHGIKNCWCSSICNWKRIMGCFCWFSKCCSKKFKKWSSK